MPLALMTDRATLEWADIGLLAGLLIAYVAAGFIYPGLVLRPFFWVVTRTVYRIRTSGTEHVPATGPVLLLSNHVTYIDWLLIWSVSPRKLRFVAWAGWKQNRIFRWFFQYTNAILIDGNGGPRQLLKSLDQIDTHIGQARGVCLPALLRRPLVARRPVEEGAGVVVGGVFGVERKAPSLDELPRCLALRGRGCRGELRQGMARGMDRLFPQEPLLGLGKHDGNPRGQIGIERVLPEPFHQAVERKNVGRLPRLQAARELGRGEFRGERLGKSPVGRDDRDARVVAARKPLKQLGFFHASEVPLHDRMIAAAGLTT